MTLATTQTGKAARSLTALATAIVAMLTFFVGPGAAQATPEAAPRTNCYLLEPDCYHLLWYHPFTTTQACYTYGIRYEDPTGYVSSQWVKCIASQPSGTVHLYVFFFTCPKQYGVKYCKEHHYV